MLSRMQVFEINQHESVQQIIKRIKTSVYIKFCNKPRTKNKHLGHVQLQTNHFFHARPPFWNSSNSKPLKMSCLRGQHSTVRVRGKVRGRVEERLRTLPKMRCACAYQNEMRLRRTKWNAHAHLISICACAYNFGMRTSFWYAHAQFLFGMRTRISFWYAHAYLI